ncbi:MAG TPA: 2-oxo-4-hydroxy-4-carboxy-5-ureidoimidazoline decarboxylase [Terracidiphilus sp.]|nr:2-oxo-4-hydroxy-4-carboxy-5-ureidoimidazoline decarboxylase [Terracidiphilus sp.]
MTHSVANPVLEEWNQADSLVARAAMIACCGATRWAEAMVAARPLSTVLVLSETADSLWATMTEADWLEAFARHPRIGERKTQTIGQSAAWSKQEQALAASAADKILAQLAQGNADYEKKFGFTYIVCATGKSAEEMLSILKRRLNSDRLTELREASEQQRQILQIRLGKWLTQ